MDEKENFQDTGPGTDREGIDEHDRRPEPEQAVAASAGNEPAAVLPEPKSDRAASQADAAGPRSESRPPERAPGEPSVGEPRTSKPGIENAPVPPPSEERLVQRTLNDILRLVGFRVRIDLVKRPDGYHANIRSRQSTGILIGHRGSTLRALQYLVRVMVRRTWPEVPPVTLDIGGYRVRRENFLKRKATAVARIVLETGREMALDVLTEKEMQLAREALKTEPGVRVYALGSGTRRNVIIAPAVLPPDAGPMARENTKGRFDLPEQSGAEAPMSEPGE